MCIRDRFKRHIIQSKEVYSYIKKAEEMGLTVEEFVNMFEGSDKELSLIHI